MIRRVTTADQGVLGSAVPVAAPSHARAGLGRMVAQDLRWAFQRPYGWLIGIVCNLVLSVAYLAIDPLRTGTHRDWAILVGTYFAVFILADVTSTNVLGVDAERTRLRLLRGVPLTKILLVKNLALLVIVGIPTLVVTAWITVNYEPGYRLTLTLPGVLYPTLLWLGVGNLVSVLLPYRPLPLRARWSQRRVWRPTTRWLFCLGLPYVLCLVVDPMTQLPRMLGQVLHLPPGPGLRGAEILVLALVFWGLLSALAVRLAHARSISLDDLL